MKWIIGIDGGGTKTMGWAADIKGKVLDQVEKGPGNYHVTGVAEFTTVIAGIIDELAISCGWPKEDLMVVSLGLAGADRENDRKIIGSALAELKLPCHYLINSDAKIALAAGLKKAEGIVLIAGTGSIAYGITEQGNVIRAGGWGQLASDEGSGYDIGRQALVRGIKAVEGRDKATVLLDKIMEYLKLTSWEELIGYINNRTTTKTDIAALAQVVTDAAAQHDQVACEILQQSGEELAGLVKAVISRGFSEEKTVQVCVYGGIVSNVPLVRNHLAAALGEKAELIIGQDQPVAGAIRLGLTWLEDNRKELG
ncbi:MAG: N-acetylglucosamine kinase [Firmicutes bacterium]|nr:N-acetylglucosamine kinase [Bacillota bacterium]